MVELTEAEQREIFDNNTNDPRQWLLTAENNLIAADALKAGRETALKTPHTREPIMRTATVGLMLRAFAIECLLKGNYVNAGNGLASGGSLIPGFPQQHRLVEMWKYVAHLPTLTADQRSVLDKLTDVSTSLGRFPVATTWRKQRPEEGIVRFSWDSAQDEVVATLVQELKSRLPSTDII